MSLSLLARSSCIFPILFFLSFSLFGQTTLFVNQQNAVSGDGLSWGNAFIDLSAAVNAAKLDATVAEIWIAKGTYQPSNSNDANEFWLWPDGVSLYGGFIGNETDKTESDPEKNPTVLDGNLGDAAQVTDNSLQLIAIENPTAAIEFNGLTFQNAGASISSLSHALQVTYLNNLDSADLMINRCIFKNNLGEKGGAIYLSVDQDSYSNAQINNCFFLANQAESGGALAFEKLDESILEIEVLNGWFKGNEATRGGAVWGGGLNGTTPNLLEWNAEFMNCVFVENTAPRGGAFYFQDSGSQFAGRAQNCTFYKNEATINGHSIYLGFNGGGDFANNIHWGEPTEKESIFFTINDGNLSVSHVMMNNLFNLATNVTSGEPHFFAAEEDDYRLSICSDAINEGNNFGLPSEDFRGLPRNYESTLDIGAYEMDGSEITLPVSTTGEATASRWITDPEGWSHYLDCGTNTRLISLKTDGQNIGTPGIAGFNIATQTDAEYGTIGIDLTEADYFSDAGHFIANRRFWKVENANAFANPIRLRFYYSEQDLTDIATLAGEPVTLADLRPFKVTGDNAYALDIMSEGGTFESYDFSAVAGEGLWTTGQSGGVDYIEFSLSSFSAGAIGFQDMNSLPLELIQFAGEAAGTKSWLHWQTRSEEEFSHFEIQRSIDQEQFSNIGMVPGNESSTNVNNYNFVDESPGLLTNYYRLKMINRDGSFEYSPLINISFNNFSKEQWHLFPNPANSAVNLVLPAEAFGELYLNLINAQGQLIKEIKLEDYRGDRIVISIEGLSAGHYFLQAKGRRINEYNPFVKLEN